MEIDILAPVPSMKAKADITRCIVCSRRFGSDDVRSNVYKDSVLIGAIHEDCYELFVENS